jgi:hypothetical protein
MAATHKRLAYLIARRFFLAPLSVAAGTLPCDILRGSCRFLSLNNRCRRSTPPLSRFIVVWSSSYWSDAELYPRRSTFFAVVCVARAGLHHRRKSMCPKRTSWLRSCGGLGMGGASGGPKAYSPLSGFHN